MDFCKNGHELTPDNVDARSRCRTCHREERRARYQANPEPQRAASRRWAKKNPEKNRARSARWRQANIDLVNERQRQAYAENIEKARAKSRRRHAANPDPGRSRALAWQAANPDAVRERARRRRARQQTAKVILFTAEQVAERMAYFGNRCWMCGGPFDHVDHVKPLAAGGPHILANLRPSCAPCNRRKSSRWPVPIQVTVNCPALTTGTSDPTPEILTQTSYVPSVSVAAPPGPTAQRA